MSVGDTTIHFDSLKPPRWLLLNPEGEPFQFGHGEAFMRYSEHFVERGFSLQLLNPEVATVRTVVEEAP